MRKSTFSTIVFFFAYFIYKLFGDNDNDYWVCGFWLVLSTYLSLLSFQLSVHIFIKKESLVWKLASLYWLSMAVVHIYFMFNIELYEIYASSVNKITLGAWLIIGIFVILLIKNKIND